MHLVSNVLFTTEKYTILGLKVINIFFNGSLHTGIQHGQKIFITYH